MKCNHGTIIFRIIDGVTRELFHVFSIFVVSHGVRESLLRIQTVEETPNLPQILSSAQFYCSQLM